MQKTQQASSEAISSLKTDATDFVLSPWEVDQRLREIARLNELEALGAKVKIRDVEQLWGDDADAVLSHPIDAAGGVTLFLLCKASTAAASSPQHQKLRLELLEMMTAVWRHSRRNSHGGLFLKHNEVLATFSHSVRRLTAQGGSENLAFIYLDLDKFKDVNDDGNHGYGDQALRHVYLCLHEMSRRSRGLAFFDGGDEFVIVIPTESRLDILFALWELRSAIGSQTFTPKEIAVSYTAGVVWRSVDEVCDNTQAVKNAAEALTKGDHGEKRRGTVTFEKWLTGPTSPQPASSVEGYLQLGACLSYSRCQLQDVFGDERLNFIGSRTRQAIGEGVSTPFADQILGLDWLGIEITDALDEHCLLEAPGQGGKLPRCAIALAVAHHLAVSSRDGEASLPGVKNETASSPARIVWDGQTGEVTVIHKAQRIWGGSGNSSDTHIELGPLQKGDGQTQTFGAAVGVQVGFSNAAKTSGGFPLPLNFFETHVLVDNRPRTGGGLPDFWQVAVAQIVAALGRSSNTTRVIFWGVDPRNTETFKRLSKPDTWPREEIAALAGLPIQAVQALGEGLSERVIVAESDGDLLKEIHLAFVGRGASAPKTFSMDPVTKVQLRRPMASSKPIGQEEAVVCETAALAYPIIIDTLRKSDHVRRSRDDADQELRELLGFKLKLTTPLLDTIPAYLYAQKSDLDAYVQTVLQTSSGLIRSKIEAQGQLKGFVNHLASYVGPARRSTRRACLVVPNEFTESGEPRPLGLLSVWATPRFLDDGRCMIDFAFVWRTVEAFIGLPYSLYGSIQLAAELVSLVAAQVTHGQSRPPQVGELTYMAMSLHLGDDHFHSRVAKRIVDLASD
ncbi:diguanylate cyclase [Caenimonas soli]|uniref:diguanylate cyclase n=1 Tax=Caenimonas soli TaxID=2735555 RepID=UPI001553D571|nr:diguanylate cyclase [Caenimonas soli]NPC57833.1 diguanylate cyclase [Caenimonas soli]